MIKRTGLAPWEFEFPFPGSLTSTFLISAGGNLQREAGIVLSQRSRVRPPESLLSAYTSILLVMYDSG